MNPSSLGESDHCRHEVLSIPPRSALDLRQDRRENGLARRAAKHRPALNRPPRILAGLFQMVRGWEALAD
jgi:hypothetical protein